MADPDRHAFRRLRQMMGLGKINAIANHNPHRLPLNADIPRGQVQGRVVVDVNA